MRQSSNQMMLMLFFLLIGAAWPARAADLTCSSSTTLDELATCIRNQMPGKASNGFVAPTATEQTDYRWVVRQMLGGSCGFPLPSTLAGILRLSTFTDATNGKSYCVLMEVADSDNNGKVDRGWGTFIVNPNATREVSQQAPHPIADSTTEIEAVLAFRDTDSRSYLMCGAHRNANPVASTCQPSYNEADCAHNVNNMFQPANAELKDFYAGQSWNAIQWHGMAEATCPANVYLSHGRNVVPDPGDKIVALQNNVLNYHPTWLIDTPGTGACSLNATENVQGRLLNEVYAGSVCDTAASLYTGVFIHNEQDPTFRDPSDWVPALNDTWPVDQAAPPNAPTNLKASLVTEGRGKHKTYTGDVQLTWNDNSDNEDKFVVETCNEITVTGHGKKQTASCTGGWSILFETGANVNSLTYTPAPGTTILYRVKAANAEGDSNYSNEASVTTP